MLWSPTPMNNKLSVESNRTRLTFKIDPTRFPGTTAVLACAVVGFNSVLYMKNGPRFRDRWTTWSSSQDFWLLLNDCGRWVSSFGVPLCVPPAPPRKTLLLVWALTCQPVHDDIVSVSHPKSLAIKQIIHASAVASYQNQGRSVTRVLYDFFEGGAGSFENCIVHSHLTCGVQHGNLPEIHGFAAVTIALVCIPLEADSALLHGIRDKCIGLLWSMMQKFTHGWRSVVVAVTDGHVCNVTFGNLCDILLNAELKWN